MVWLKRLKAFCDYTANSTTSSSSVIVIECRIAYVYIQYYNGRHTDRSVDNKFIEENYAQNYNVKQIFAD